MIVGRSLSKTFRAAERRQGNVPVLRDVSFSIKEGEFYILLGPSGSGKTTTLRAVAGLEQPDAGEIDINGEVVFSAQQGVNVAPERRPIAMVFQSYALWPHMNVYENIAFPLRRGIRRVSRDDIAPRIRRVLELLHLTEHAQRPIATLSGGQQQRVALARALALEPAVLLMDEPLSNLDAKLRAQLRVELKELTRQIGITTLYVTHDQLEAMVMGDRVAVMSQGRILQEGRPSELYQHPRDLFVARFLGEMNFISGRVQSANSANAHVVTEAGALVTRRIEGSPSSGEVLAGFRPEDAMLVEHDSANTLRGTVASSHYLGDIMLHEIRVGTSLAQIRRPKSDTLKPGQDVILYVPPECCIAFANDETAIQRRG
jgi:iron(III) transport system ATP-binding protein